MTMIIAKQKERRKSAKRDQHIYMLSKEHPHILHQLVV
jgi:hypothetical protein